MTVYAGLVSRFLAYVLDALIVALVTGGSVITVGLIASVISSGARQLAHTLLVSYVVFLPLILALYCAAFWLLAGRTPGMAVLGLRVVAAKGRRVHWFAALVRGLLLAYFPIGALTLVANRRHLAVHDMIARTSVVRIP